MKQLYERHRHYKNKRICVDCGSEFPVKGGNPKRCTKCAAIADRLRNQRYIFAGQKKHCI
jgi:hypothetical protein